MTNESGARLQGKVYRIFIALLLVYAVLSSFGPMMNNVDLGWQVAQGRWMIEHGAPYSHDVFNYPNLDRAVINEYPLWEIVLFTAWSFGWWGPCLLTAAAYVGLILLFLRGAWRVGLPESASTALALGLMFLFFQVAWPLRPHVATYLGIAFFGTFLLTHRESARWISFWPLALAQVAWTNCHSGFIFGPALVGLFGAEMILRRWWRDRAFHRATTLHWLAVFTFVLLACFVNPSGYARFYPPLFQDRLESIRAYVGEMEPLTGGAAMLIHDLVWFSTVVVAAAVLRRRGISFAFLLLAAFTLLQAEEIKKAWPVLGIFAPLLVLSTAAFGPTLRRAEAWLGLVLLFVGTALVALAVMGRLNSGWDSGIARQWAEYDAGHTELPVDAVAWMKENHLSGRIFHRCEDGGLLQQQGFDQTFADTGFGKYDEDVIHEVGLVNERPALVPLFIAKYRPDFVVCGNFCYQWPYYLRAAGWRLIFYTPNSSVWTRPNLHPELPAVTDEQIERAFNQDLATNGRPDAALLGRNLIALNSLGLEEFAFAQLTGLPKDDHAAAWYWEAARILCFESPVFSAVHRQALNHEAEASLLDVTADFRGHYDDIVKGDPDGALVLLARIPPGQLNNSGAELLLGISLEMQGGLALARRTDCWDLRDGKHWQYLAQAEEKWGSLDAARAAWKRAVFYYPDDAELMDAASAFAAKHHDAELQREITDTIALWSPR